MPEQAHAPTRGVTVRILSLLGLLVLGGIAVGVFWSALGLPGQRVDDVIQPVPMLGIGVLVLAVALGASVIPMRRFEGRGLATIGLGWSPGWARRAAFGLLAGGLTPATATAVLTLFGVATTTAASPNLLTETLPAFLGLAMLSSWEEIFLRGYLMQLIIEKSSPMVGATVTGILFGLLHAGNPGANRGGLIYTALGGVLLGLLVIRTGSLWLVCGYHAGWNLLAALGLGLRDSGMMFRGALALTDLEGPSFLTGGDYGFEASVVTGVLELLILGFLVWRAPNWKRDETAWPYFQCRDGVRGSGDTT